MIPCGLFVLFRNVPGRFLDGVNSAMVIKTTAGLTSTAADFNRSPSRALLPRERDCCKRRGARGATTCARPLGSLR